MAFSLLFVTQIVFTNSSRHRLKYLYDATSAEFVPYCYSSYSRHHLHPSLKFQVNIMFQASQGKQKYG